jgi:hypothetical protein
MCRDFLQSHFHMRDVLIEDGFSSQWLTLFFYPMGTLFAWVLRGCGALCLVAPKRTNATQGEEKMKAVHLKQIVLAAVGAAGLSVAGGTQAGYIDAVTNLEWRQLTETVNISYNALNTGGVNGCSAATGACSGSLGAVDLTGWTWATEPEVRLLFHNFSGAQFIPGFTPLPGAPTNYNEESSLWAPAILDIDGAGVDTGIFDATRIIPLEMSVSGITRTDAGNGVQTRGAVIVDDLDFTGINGDVTIGRDKAITNTAVFFDDEDAHVGVWLYRQAPTSDVPVPPAPWLLAIGIAALWSVRRLTARVA